MEKQVLGVTEFLIEAYENKDCQVREEGKCYIPMFKYEQEEGEGHWCFSLPVKPLYLMKTKEAKEMIIKSIEQDTAHGWKAEYRLAKIVNPKPEAVPPKRRVTIEGMDRETGEITIKIDALGTMYVPKIGKYSTTLLNGAPLLEGIELLMEYGHLAVKAIKKELKQ